MTERSVSPDIIRELTSIVDDCDMYRFVPASAESNSKADTIFRSKKLLENLEDEWK